VYVSGGTDLANETQNRPLSPDTRYESKLPNEPNNPFVFRPLVQRDHYLKAQRLRSRVAAQRLRNRIGHVHRDSVIPKICLRSAEDVDPLPRLDKVSAVRDAVEKLIADVYAGKLHPRVAAGLAPRLNLQLRAVEATDLERHSPRWSISWLKTRRRALWKGTAKGENVIPASRTGQNSEGQAER
jgi:hypothetical protein